MAAFLAASTSSLTIILPPLYPSRDLRMIDSSWELTPATGEAPSMGGKSLPPSVQAPPGVNPQRKPVLSLTRIRPHEIDRPLSPRPLSPTLPPPSLTRAPAPYPPRCSLPPLSALTCDQKAAILPSHPLSRLPRCIALGTCSQSTHQTTSNLHSAPLLFLSYLLSHTPASLVIPSRQNLMKISVC
jgi:hypothetical protein